MLLVRNKNSFLGAAIWCFVGTPSYMVEQKCPDNNHKCSKLETECKLNMPQESKSKSPKLFV